MTQEVIFSHKHIKNSLVLYTKPDQITWGYGLNTQNYPTYGGEVVQILSMFFDDMTITGTVAQYKQLESIHMWFLRYIQLATQGTGGGGSYDTTPITFSYPHRGWNFKIYPKSMPDFKYGTEVVAPEWKIQCAVSEPDADLKELIMSERQFTAIHGGDFDTFGTATADIGYYEDNPWSGPTDQAYKKGESKDGYKRLGDYFTNLIPSWLNDDFKNLSANYSRPAFLKGATTNDKNTGTPNSTKKVVAKKKGK